MTRPAIWFLAIRAGTGADVFTQRLFDGIRARGFRAEVTWLPHRAEYMPWTVKVPEPPAWANVVHVNTWMHKRFVPADMPAVATMHHSVHDAALNPYKSVAQAVYHRFWIRPIERWILSHASRVVAVSRYTALMAREAFGTEGIQVVHNGLDIREYPDVERQGPGHPFRLLYIGSWSKRKGVDMLVPIMESLGEGYELRFSSADGKQGQHSSLPFNCVPIERINQEALLGAYATSDALLLPSRLEGFGQVAIEAMACGTPVVATNCSALPEVVEDGVTGFLCRQDDVTSFENAVRRMAADRALWRHMSGKARARVVREFDASSMIDKYLAIYRSLL